MICWRCGGKHCSTANVRYGTKACAVQCHCMKCGKDDHSTEHHDIGVYSDVQERGYDERRRLGLTPARTSGPRPLRGRGKK